MKSITMTTKEWQENWTKEYMWLKKTNDKCMKTKLIVHDEETN